MKTLEQMERDLEAIVGDRVTISAIDRGLYSDDVAALPSVLKTLFGRATPDVVVRPRSAEEISAVVKYAYAHRIPVTPRAAGTTAFHNTVPANGGIVVDLNDLQGILDVDSERNIATVLAATRWKELDDLLRYSWHLAVRTCPTSAPSGTVGGWFNMGGLGLGSLQYGPFKDMVHRIWVVLPNSNVRVVDAASDPPISWFAGSEGTLGIVTQLTLSIREAPEVAVNCLAAFEDAGALQRVAEELVTSQPSPYHIHINNDAFAKAMVKAGLSFPNMGHRFNMLVRYEGAGREVEIGISKALSTIRHYGGQHLAATDADIVWEHRFAEVAIKRVGPSLLGSEILLPLRSLPDYLAAANSLGANFGVDVIVYGNVVAEKWVQINAFYLADERQELIYFFSLSITKKLYDLAMQHGGRPYGIGRWNIPYVQGPAFDAERHDFIRRKRLLDPHEIMNPGKMHSSSLLLAPPIFGAAMGILAAARRISVWLLSPSKGD